MRSRPRLLALAVVALAIQGGGCGLGTAPREAVESERFFGINGDLLFNLVIANDLTLVDRHLDQLEQLGIAYVRSQADWRRVEPVPPGIDGDRDFAVTDAWVERLAHHGLAWQVLGNGRPIPRWAADPEDYRRCGSRAAPAGPAAFAAYMAALAQRYGPGGEFWRENPEVPAHPATVYEVWNEPNHFAFWCPRPDPHAYARLLARTAAAIHAAEPAATVLVGGLAAFEPTSRAPAQRMPHTRFLRLALSAKGALGHIGGVAVHPYGPSPDEVMDQLRSFRIGVDAAGLTGKPLHVNEVGWFTRGQGGWLPTPETVRAEFLRSTTAAIWAAREPLEVAAFAPYSWATQERDPRDPLDWLGIADPLTGRPYPSALAYAEAVRDTD